MTQEQPQEQKSLVDRIVAPTKEDEANASEFLEELFELKDPMKLEMQKTPEEVEIIQQINSCLADFLKSYGIVRTKKIPPEKIRILDRDQLNDEQSSKINSFSFRGRYFPIAQHIIIIPDGSAISDISTIIHEMLHAQSFLSFDVRRVPEQASGAVADYDEVKLKQRRKGLKVYTFINNKPKDATFSMLDEAVIEELTKEFYYKFVSKLTSTRDLFNKAEEIKKEHELDDSDVSDVQTENFADGSWRATIWSFGYKKERSDLWDLIDDIFESDKSGEFQSREDVFKLFVHAQMTGHLLKLGREINRVYGRGAFKFLGEITKDVDKDT